MHKKENIEGYLVYDFYYQFDLYSTFIKGLTYMIPSICRNMHTDRCHEKLIEKKKLATLRKSLRNFFLVRVTCEANISLRLLLCMKKGLKGDEMDLMCNE